MRPKWFVLVVPGLVLVWVLNASRPGGHVEGCLSECANLMQTPGSRLRIVSLNMLHGFPKFEHLSQRLEIIAHEIKRLDADIVLLQEVPWTLKTGNGAGYLAEKIGMNYAYQRANGNRWAILFEEGEAILSRYPLSTPESLELKPREGFFRHRVALYAAALTPFGRIELYTAHLTNGGAAMNVPQSESLARFVGLKPNSFAIIAGDFNAKPESTQIQALPLQWIDPFDNRNPKTESYTCCVDNLLQKTADPDERIDYFFLLPGDSPMSVVATERVFDQSFKVPGGWLWASDHLGLMVDLVGRMVESQ